MKDASGAIDSAQNDRVAPALDASGGRWLRRHLAGSVVALTTVVDGDYRGATVTACLPVSTDPIQILVALEEDSQMRGWIESSGIFVVNILPWREQFIADQFAGYAPRASRAFGGIEHVIGATGAPILRAAIAWAECAVVQTLVTGDHVSIIGQASSLGTAGGNEDDPLLYYLSRYRRIG